MPLLWDVLARAAARWANEERAPIHLKRGDLISIDGALFAHVRDVTTPSELAAKLPPTEALIDRVYAARADSVAIIAIAGTQGDILIGVLIRTAGKWSGLDGKPLRISTVETRRP